MDLRCPKCGEPWDMDELHDVPGMSFNRARDRFAKVGCEVFDNPHNEVADEDAAKARALHDILGDDIDGIAAMEEDFA